MSVSVAQNFFMRDHPAVVSAATNICWLVELGNVCVDLQHGREERCGRASQKVDKNIFKTSIAVPVICARS